MPLVGQPFADAGLSGIVTGGNGHPVAEFVQGVLQELTGGNRFFLNVVAFINLGADLQSVLLCRRSGELPQPCGPGRRKGLGVEVALDGHQVFQILRDSILFQDGDQLLEIPPGTLEDQGGVGVHVGIGNQFPVHPFLVVRPVEADGISGKDHVNGHDGCLFMQDFGAIRFLGCGGNSKEDEAENGEKVLHGEDCFREDT